VQNLVYLFIFLVGVAIAVATYFGLTFTPIEAGLAGLVAIAFCLLVLERAQRRRAVARLERSVQDLSRLLSTDAQAGQALNQRLNRLEDVEPRRRFEVVEADVSVLGTVVRQLAETVSDLEDAEARRGGSRSAETKAATEAAAGIGPAIPIHVLREALDAERLLHHVQPIVTLPQRRTHGYDFVPRLELEDGEIAEPADFWPQAGGADLIRRIEFGALREAIALARRARTAGKPATLYVPLSAPTLIDPSARENLKGLLSANEAIGDLLCFRIPQEDWAAVQEKDESILEMVANHKAGFSLDQVGSLRLNYSSMAALGVRSVRAEAKRFIDSPATYTDFHTADISAYLGRFEIELIVTDIADEPQILTLLDDGVGLVQGPHISAPGPVRTDLMLEPDTGPRQQAAGR